MNKNSMSAAASSTAALTAAAAIAEASDNKNTVYPTVDSTRFTGISSVDSSESDCCCEENDDSQSLLPTTTKTTTTTSTAASSSIIKTNTISPNSIPLFPLHHPSHHHQQHQQQQNLPSAYDSLMNAPPSSTSSSSSSSIDAIYTHPRNAHHVHHHVHHHHHQQQLYMYPEDDEGEPVVDESVLQNLLQQQQEREQQLQQERNDDEEEEDDEENDCDDYNNSTTTTSPGESLLLRDSLLMKHGRHPSTILEEQVIAVDPQNQHVLPPPQQQQQQQNLQRQQQHPLFQQHHLHLTSQHQQQYENSDSNHLSISTATATATGSLRRTKTSTMTLDSPRQNLLLPSSGITKQQQQQQQQPYDIGNNINSPLRSNYNRLSPSSPSSSIPLTVNAIKDPLDFQPYYSSTRYIQHISRLVVPSQHVNHAGAATWIGFWALLHVTCANYMLTPMRDAIALHVGVQHIPKLTLASTLLAVFSSVPIGWLFEAPDPCRRRLWKRMGLTRGETQGTSLALFYRVFALSLIAYAVGFQFLEWIRNYQPTTVHNNNDYTTISTTTSFDDFYLIGFINVTKIWTNFAPAMFIAFFLLVHLMKLHCLSLVWGVTTEAMEYEEVARKQYQQQLPSGSTAKVPMESQKMRLKRLALVGFGGTVGGILGSMIASTTAQILKLPGLLLLAAFMLEISAELSIELGRIMKKHWEGQQQLFQSSNDLASLDHSMLRSSSLGSMKRISSGNSLNRVRSTSDLGNSNSSNTNNNLITNKTLSPATSFGTLSRSRSNSMSLSSTVDQDNKLSEDSFSQRMVRGISTILKSRLLMAIFTYNALYASTTVLLSFQRAELIANRNNNTTVQADTAFLANINMASSAAIFALQASGIGAYVAHSCGPRTTLALMPLIRLIGVVALAWWHRTSGGQAPNLIVFLIVDECCKIMNLAVAKPVRESLWRGLSNEARYEAKPIVDTLANRWGGGSAAFLVSFVDKTLDLFGGTITSSDPQQQQRELGLARTVFGFPPVLFLCVIITAWWAAVSADLGQIRKNIDIELKKRQ